MIQAPGQLTIKTINGRNGLFNVGQIDLDIGKFAVRDAMLDEYSEGIYHGTFAIRRIFSGSYQTGNRFVIETRAELANIWLDNFDERPVTMDETVNIDPLAEERAAQQLAQQPPAQAEPATEQPQNSDDLSPAAIFGALWPLGNVVKLDPTSDRELMRAQVNYLKAQLHDGKRVWLFQPQEKIWVKQCNA
ncbi:DUF3275 family protein (plasmid) [Photobacterium leiognathi subsp. mandapamensis]|uniref:DUF3275 family protein n=1 Tax=Photobacterium leiognathi TaxID=553611 RepID=UPI003AF3DBE7